MVKCKWYGKYLRIMAYVPGRRSNPASSVHKNGYEVSSHGVHDISGLDGMRPFPMRTNQDCFVSQARPLIMRRYFPNFFAWLYITKG